MAARRRPPLNAEHIEPRSCTLSRRLWVLRQTRFLGDNTYPNTAVAHTDCCVLAISGADFRSILRRRPQVAAAAHGPTSRTAQLEAANKELEAFAYSMPGYTW